MANNANAQIGYVGSVQLDTGTEKIVVRVTSSDIKTQQEITYPEVIDGKVDTTLYQLGPKLTGGNVAFPLVHEGGALPNPPTGTCLSSTDTLAAKIWAFAAQRNSVGRMANTLTAHVRYADNTAFSYPGCYINTITFNVVQSDSVNVTAEMFGGASSLPGVDPSRSTYGGDLNPSFLSPARVVTWNDSRVEVYDDNASEMLSGAGLREFTVTLNNGLERVYTMNGKLAVFDIVAKKREISGTLKVLGRCKALGDWAYGNESRYTSSSAIAFGYTLGGNIANAYWANAFYGVIFQIEEMALTTGVFETTHNWRALGDCQRSFLATSMGKSNVTISDPSNGSGGVLPYPSSTTYGISTGCDDAGANCFPSGFGLGNS